MQQGTKWYLNPCAKRFAVSRKQGNQFSTELVQLSPNLTYQVGELYYTGMEMTASTFGPVTLWWV